VSSNEEMQNQVKMGHVWVTKYMKTEISCNFFRPHIQDELMTSFVSSSSSALPLSFFHRWQSVLMKKCKIRSKVVTWGSRDPLLEFWVKFGVEMDGSEFQRKNAQLYQKGSRGGYVTHFWNCGTP